MGSQISISTPFLKGISHSDVTIGTTKSLILEAPTEVYVKRIVVIVQNKSSAATIQVIGNATDSVGLAVPPLGSIKLDNYNGLLYALSSSAGTSVHIAISAV
jgi:hypothetical protein